MSVPTQGRPSAKPGTAESVCREWYESHGRAVYGYLRFHLPSADLAEDLTAEVFLRAVRSENRFDSDRASARTWLLRIARNALVDHLRRERRRDQVPLAALRDLQTDAPSPEERLLWEEEVGHPAIPDAASVTVDCCCYDLDGGGPADDGRLVIGVPPDRVVMAAIYQGDPAPRPAAPRRTTPPLTWFPLFEEARR